MKLYYYVKDSQRNGPFSYSQLQAEEITPDTLVWFEGLPSWQFAKDLSELADIFDIKPLEPVVEAPEPPPLLSIKEEEETPLKEDVENEMKKPMDEPFIESEPEYSITKQGMFSNPFGSKGRIRRTEYWISIILFYIYIAIISAFTGGMGGNSNDKSALLMVLFLIPGYWFIIAQNAKRCHDRGNSGWYQLIPFYGLWMAFAEGDFNDNDYGPNPKR